MEETYGHRLQIARQHQDPRIIEGEIDCGQIEELITQAEDVRTNTSPQKKKQLLRYLNPLSYLGASFGAWDSPREALGSSRGLSSARSDPSLESSPEG